MEKSIQFDFRALGSLVESHIRGQLGWYRGLTVSFPRANHHVRIYQNNVCSRLWEDDCSRCMLGCATVGVYCCVAWCIQSAHTQSGIASVWEIDCSARQVFFEAVQRQLYTTYHGRRVLDYYGNEPFW